MKHVENIERNERMEEQEIAEMGLEMEFPEKDRAKSAKRKTDFHKKKREKDLEELSKSRRVDHREVKNSKNMARRKAEKRAERHKKIDVDVEYAD